MWILPCRPFRQQVSGIYIFQTLHCLFRYRLLQMRKRVLPGGTGVSLLRFCRDDNPFWSILSVLPYYAREPVILNMPMMKNMTDLNITIASLICMELNKERKNRYFSKSKWTK